VASGRGAPLTSVDRAATRLWLAAAALAVAAGLVTTTHGDFGADGTWVLQVVARLHAGDVLYRDVFAGVPPLTFQLVWLATRFAGLEFVVLRVLLVIVVVVSCLVSADLLRRVTGTHRYDLVLAPMMLIWALPANASLYQPLANLFLIASMDLVAWWSCSHAESQLTPVAPFVAAGAMAGLSFGAKQTTGAFAFLAVAVAIALESRRRRLAFASVMKAWGLTGVGFAAAVTTVLAPVACSGAWQRFIEYGFTAKGTYVRVGGVPYIEGLAILGRAVWPSASFSLLAAIRNQPFLLPLVLLPAILVLVRSAWRAAAPAGAALALALGVAEAATLFPRSDLDHLVPAVPGLLVALLAAWHLGREWWAGRLTDVVEFVCLAVVMVGVVVRLGASAHALTDQQRVWSDLPHLRYVLMPAPRAASLDAEARALHAAAPGGRLFLLTPNAGLYYLVSGVTNPTPFDYPLVTAFGLSGEADLARSIAGGGLRDVCMTPIAGPLAPERLQRAVVAHMSATADLAVCTLYHR
jgi:hypothetical protein